MTPPPYLTRDARWAVEKALRHVGWLPIGGGGLLWASEAVPERVLDLREVFPSPWPGSQDESCTCLLDHVCDPNAEPRCPVHGGAS